MTEICRSLGIAEEGCSVLERYLKLLLNSPVNLTSTRDLQVAFVKHVEDVAIPFGITGIKGDCIDIGSGGGLPGLVLAILFPETKWVLSESRQAKATQLLRFVKELSLSGVQISGERVEEYGRNHPEAFDNAVIRAVGRADLCLEYAAPLLKLSGSAFLFKGPNWRDEIRYSAKACSFLGMNLARIIPYTLSDHSQRYLIEYTKVSATPNQFPRKPGLAAKRPLGNML